MVNADVLLAGIQPQLDTFLRPDEARRAANVLKAALKEFATDAFTNLQLVRERTRADAIEAAESLDRSLEQCKAMRREWEREVRQQRDTFSSETAMLSARLDHAHTQVRKLEALAAANAAAAKADMLAAAAAADADRRRTAAEMCAERLRHRRQARAHAAALAARMLSNERDARARLECVLAELRSLEGRVASFGSERAALLEDMCVVREARAKMSIAVKEALSNQQARAAADLRQLGHEKDATIASLTHEVERLRAGAQRVLKAKDTSLEAALQQLFFDSLKHESAVGHAPRPPTPARCSAPQYAPSHAQHARPRAPQGGRRPHSSTAGTSSPRRTRAEAWRPRPLNICEPWRAGKWE